MKRKLVFGFVILLLHIAGGLGYVVYKHRSGVAEAAEVYSKQSPKPVGDMGATSTLEVLPLVDWPNW